jgi:hypothetical protein
MVLLLSATEAVLLAGGASGAATAGRRVSPFEV